jgi:ABC-type spermidine/putrescine transport system permease subunit II
LLGAMLLVGALVLSASALLIGWRGGQGAMVRLGFRSLWMGALPAWIVMRAGAEWIANKEHLEDSDVSWITIGFNTADIGLVVMLIATLLGGLGVRRLARGQGDGNALGRGAALLVAVLLVAYVVAIWAMTTKPG